MQLTWSKLWNWPTKDGLLVKDLGSRLYLDSGTLTPLLKKLKEKNYIDLVQGTLDILDFNLFPLLVK